MFDMIISEARNFGIKELLPTYMQGDREGVNFDKGEVKVPACFHRAYELFAEGEWLAMAEDPAYGGQGLPRIIKQAAYEYIFGANYGLTVTATLGHGTGKIIERFGTPKQKELFLEKVYSGKWAGTIMMNEARLDVGAQGFSQLRSGNHVALYPAVAAAKPHKAAEPGFIGNRLKPVRGEYHNIQI